MDAKLTGKIIAEKRKALGLNQIQLGEKLNVSNRTVSKWENGDGYPDITFLPELAGCLGITIDELLTGEAPAPPVAKQTGKDKHINDFMVCFIVSLFLVIFSALLGTITEIYCIWAFPILFYTHWEIMFDAVSLFSIVAGLFVYSFSIIRLNLTYSKRKILNIAGRKGLLVLGVSSIFPLSFLYRINVLFSHHTLWKYGVILLAVIIVIALIFAVKWIKKNEKED